DRNSVYIANVLKCRPPNNRNPLPEEIEACTDYVRIQIELIKPSVICSLGLFAGQFLLDNPMLKMGEMRGKEFDYNGIPVIPTYHPAYLLRNPSQKKVVWDDMIKIMKLLGIKNKYTAGAKDSEDQI
ncbi:MAG: uracil-DNA glycosylase, partial [bacterium]|nr:uracil-DNA glycosylase [bacterium]